MTLRIMKWTAGLCLCLALLLCLAFLPASAENGAVLGETEDNNTFRSANRIDLNTTCTGSLSDSYSSEQDWYVFTLAEPGVIVVLLDTEMQDSNNPYWDMNLRTADDPDTRIWEQAVNGYSVRSSSMKLALRAGTYYFEIESSNNWSQDPYRFMIQCEPANGWEAENNNSFRKANPVELNAAYKGVLQAPYTTEQDWYSFTLPENGTVVVSFSTAMQENNDNYWDISLRRADNPDEKIWNQFITGYTTETKSMILGLPAGAYYFEAEASNNLSTEEYTFCIQYEQLTNWEVESNNTFSKANRLDLNRQIYGVLQDYYSNECDWYVFTLDRAASVTLRFGTAMQETTDAYWDISLRPGNNPDEKLWQTFVDGMTTNTAETFSLDAGTYFIELESSSKWSSSPYTIEIIR